LGIGGGGGGVGSACGGKNPAFLWR
jgi:hypothetical protein